MDHEISLDLGKIQTQWSLVRRAHENAFSMNTANVARNALVLRYAGSIHRFVQIVVRDPELAEELAQDAIVRLLKGDFAGADPHRGRFRDLLKTAIRNMAKTHWAESNRRSSVDFDLSLLESDAEDNVARLDDAWTGEWRDQLLEIAWRKLQEQDLKSGAIAYTVLQLRAQYPEDKSEQLAERLSATTGREYKADNTRQLLRRSRVRFAEILVAEIAEGLEDASPQKLHDELLALGLYASVKDVLPTEWQ